MISLDNLLLTVSEVKDDPQNYLDEEDYPEYATMTLDEFEQAALQNVITDDDGIGKYVVNGKEANDAFPSEGLTACFKGATHINWYNK